MLALSSETIEPSSDTNLSQPNFLSHYDTYPNSQPPVGKPNL